MTGWRTKWGGGCVCQGNRNDSASLGMLLTLHITQCLQGHTSPKITLRIRQTKGITVSDQHSVPNWSNLPMQGVFFTPSTGLLTTNNQSILGLIWFHATAIRRLHSCSSSSFFSLRLLANARSIWSGRIAFHVPFKRARNWINYGNPFNRLASIEIQRDRSLWPKLSSLWMTIRGQQFGMEATLRLPGSKWQWNPGGLG